MSNMDAVRAELGLTERREPPRLPVVAAVVLLLLGAGAGLAEIHLLPTFSADDFSSVLFGAG